MRCRPFLAVIALMSFAFFSVRPAGAQSASALDGRPSSGTGTAAAPVDSPLPSAEEIVARYEAATGAREVKEAFTTRFVKGLYQSEDSLTELPCAKFAMANRLGSRIRSAGCTAIPARRLKAGCGLHRLAMARGF
jgi:hypothetical protein